MKYSESEAGASIASKGSDGFGESICTNAMKQVEWVVRIVPTDTPTGLQKTKKYGKKYYAIKSITAFLTLYDQPLKGTEGSKIGVKQKF
jgi:hypothetical protein